MRQAILFWRKISSVEHTHFLEHSPGELIQTINNAWAFLPHSLPPQIEPPSWEFYNLLLEAERALSKLDGLTHTLPNPRLLLRPFAQREAVLSSRIEGTVANVSDLVLFDASEYSEPTSDVREVANYVLALEMGLRWVQENQSPISLALIRGLHEQLMKGVRGGDRNPGQFRVEQNWIGVARSSIHESRFVPPPPLEVVYAMNDLERFINTASPLPDLIRLALIHYQFETIHPFSDGNGRVGRLLLPLFLCSQKMLTQPTLNLSAYFEHNRAAYCDGLLRVSQTGQWYDWIEFFLRGVALQANDATEKTKQLWDLRERYRQRLQQTGSSAKSLQLVDMLFSSPAFSVARAEKFLSVTRRGAVLNIEKLQSKNILREVEWMKQPKIYIAPEIMEILET